MKKLIFILILFFLVVNENVKSHPGWTWINPYPTGEDLSSIKFINENTGFAVGNEGSFLKTTNGGLNWFLQTVSINHLQTIFFFNYQTGYITGQNGLILKTTNSGNNWVQKLSGSIQNLNDITFISAEIGFVVGNAGTFIKTTDAGESWGNISVNFNDNLKQIIFFSSQMGFMCGQYYIRKTINGGINWFTVYSNSNLKSMYFIDSSNGHACGWGGLVARTTNGGQNWIGQILIDWSLNNSIHFQNLNTGYICGYFGVLYKTTTAGFSWIFQNYNTINQLNSINFSNSQTGYIAGQVGCLLKTTNEGINWFSVNGIKNTLLWMEFPSPDVGYICGGGGRVLITTNGGENWSAQKINYSFPFYKLRAPSENVCYVAGDSIMYKTSDRGATWNIVKSGNISIYESFDFPDELNGFAFGGSDFIMRTTNGGTNWFNQYNGLNGSYIWPMKFINASTGFGSHYEYFYLTTNSGINWTLLTINAEYFNDMDFVDAFTGYLATDKGAFKTTNSGFNWTTSNTGNVYLQKIVFPNANTGYALGDLDYLIKTTNGGLNWNTLPDNISYELHDIEFVTEDVGYLCGLGGAILRTTTGGTIVSSPVSRNLLTNSYSLSQNYPNPFNPSTTIKFDLPKSSHVQIVVYDILGREVQQLLNEQRKPGSYEVTWDGSRFASGIYFYKIITDDFVETKKMVLMK